MMLLVAAMTMDAAWGNKEVVDGVEWTYEVSGGYAVVGSASGYANAIDNGIVGEVVVPSRLGGYEVRRIGRYAFARCRNVTSFKIPETVREIDGFAFAASNVLKRIEIPKSVEKINGNPFASLFSLEEIAVSNGNANFKAIDGVLYDVNAKILVACPCSKANVVIPEGVKEIGEHAFHSNFEVTSVVLPDSVETISDFAFQSCGELNELTISRGLKHIGESAFKACDKLTSDINLPEGVTNIGVRAFAGCSWLPSATLPNSLKVLGTEAFRDCGKLVDLTIGKGISSLPTDVFRSCGSLGRIEIPGSVKAIGDNAFRSAGATSVVFRAGTETVGDYAFFACLSLEMVELPETLRVIGCCAFEQCSDLRGCLLPEGLETLGDGAFAWCRQIGEMRIPSTVAQMGGGVFSGCASLSSVLYSGNQPEFVASNVYSGTPVTLVSYVSPSDPSWATDLARKVWRDRAITTPGGDVIHYTVELDATGGDVETASLSFQRGVKVGDLPKPVKNGFAFIGWFTDPNGGAAVSPSLEVTEDMRLYAHWTRSSDERLYMVVHLDAGPDATSYPVTYLSDVPDGGWSDEYKTTKLVLRRIEPGTFKMCGKCNVSLSTPYYMGVFEVTRKQCELVYGKDTSRFSSSKGSNRVNWTNLSTVKGLPLGKKLGMPVQLDDDSFIGRLRLRTGLDFDLPTEAQWEYACRAGTTSLYNNGGNTEDDLNNLGYWRWNYKNSSGYNMVGAYAPNAWGLYDMHGGAWEICTDYYGELALSEGMVDPVGPDHSDTWVIRGGGSQSQPDECTSNARTGVDAGAIAYVNYETTLAIGGHYARDYASEIGFRICLPLTVEKREICEIICDFQTAERPRTSFRRIAGEKLGPVSAPERVGFDFAGWFYDQDFTSPALADDIVPEGGVQIYAKWERNGEVEKEGEYVVIDLSSGPAAVSYPVTFLDAVPSGGWSDEYKTEKLVLRRIDSGSFMMGNYAHYPDKCKLVNLTRPFYIGVFEVTQHQWELVTGARPSKNVQTLFYKARPVEWISYDEVRGADAGSRWPDSDGVDPNSFLGVLRARTGLALDMPTSSQWEYACKAGGTTDFNNGVNFPSNDIGGFTLSNEVSVPGRTSQNKSSDRYSYNYVSDGGNFFGCGLAAGSAAVGSYAPNAWGLYDMHGNVSEWCLDWYSAGIYSGDDPVGPTSGSRRTIRGGDYADQIKYYASWATEGYRTDKHFELDSWDTYHVGLRLCLTVGALPPAGTCTVTFNAAGGTCSETSRSVARGSSIGALPSVSRVGYDFMGWKCDKEIISADYVVNGDRTCYAQWRQKGLVVKPGSCESAAVALAYSTVEKSASARLDYEYLENSYKYYDYDDNSDEMCVYYYKIVLNKGQGFAAWIDGDESGDLELAAYRPNGANTPKIYSYIDSNCYRVMPYNWADSHDDTATYYIEIEGPLNEPFTLHYIGFNKTSSTKYTVKYDANGGVYDMEEDDVLYGDGFRLPGCRFEKPGHEFAGWAKSRTGVVVYQDEESVRNLTTPGKSITLYAIWAKEGSAPAPTNVYTVRFNANGGKGSMQNQTFTIGKEQALAKNAFAVSGRTFLGWTTKSSGQVQITDLYMDEDTVVNLTDKSGGVVDLYAVWLNPSHVSTVRLRKTADWDEYVWTTSVAVSRGESHLFWIEGVGGDDDCWLDVAVRNDEGLWAGASVYWEFENTQGVRDQYVLLTEDDWKSLDTSASSVSFLVTVSACDDCPNSTLKFGHMSGSIPVELTWRVTFDPGEGDFDWHGAIPVGYAKTVEYKNNAALGTPEIPMRSRYKFLGWFTSEIGGTKVTASTKVTEDVTYYAHWERNSSRCVAVFDANGGECDVASGNTVWNKPFGELPVAVRWGYGFAGWHTDPEYGIRVDETSIVEDDVVLYAHWVPLSSAYELGTLYGTTDSGAQVADWKEMYKYAQLAHVPIVFLVGWNGCPYCSFIHQSVLDAGVWDLPCLMYYDYYQNLHWFQSVESSLFKPRDGYSEGNVIPAIFCYWNLGNGKAVRKFVSLRRGEDYVRNKSDYLIDKDAITELILSAFESPFENAEADAGLVICLCDEWADDDGTFELDLNEQTISGATPKFAVKGLPPGLKFDAKTGVISGKATKPGKYTVTVSATNASVKKAVTATFDIVVSNLASEKLPGLEQETDAYGVVTCGVAFDPGLVDCAPEDGWTLKAAGLPAGLKLVQDKNTKAYSITGVPTKAGTFTVTFTATKKGEKSEVATITLDVEAAPDWAVGTFWGNVKCKIENGELEEESYGSATMTVAANGKISGKVALDGTNWTFKADSFSRVDSGNGELGTGNEDVAFVINAVATAGKIKREMELRVTDGGGFGETALPEGLINARAEGGTEDGEWSLSLWRNMWKDKATAAAAKSVLAEYTGVYTVSLDPGADYGSGYLSLTVGKDGNVKATGKLADGTSVSMTSPLMYDAGAGHNFAYFHAAPSAYKGGAFALTVSFEFDEGQKMLGNALGIAQWTSRNPQATGEYGAGFDREVSFVGAYYNKLDVLRKYYEALRLSFGGGLGEAALPGGPALAYTYKETHVNGSGKKVTESESREINAIDTLGQDGLTAAVNEKGAFVVAKATKPVQDKTTKAWSYNGANDGAMTLSFTQATGIFKGTYTFWYDYVSAYDETTGKETKAHTSKKVNFEGILVQGEGEMRGFYLWDASSSYDDPKTGKPKTYKYKESHPVTLAAP